jgi:arylsulfatase A-like enzyme
MKNKNVLIIFGDQLMKFALGCMDNSDVVTPNIDRLAQNGALFKNAYTTTPVCSPFRANLVTGLYNLETGADGNCCVLPNGCHSLVSDFNNAGYQTGFVGKWHIGIGGNRPIEKKYRADFQNFIGYQCFNSFYEDVWFFDEDNKKHEYDKHRTDVTADIAIERLQKLSDDPFMMVVGFQAPHYPEQPSPRFDNIYRGKKVTPRPNYTGISPYIPTVFPRSSRPYEKCPDYRRYGEDIHEYLRCYYALCSQIDYNVGRIVDQLEESGRLDDTIIMFTSDHGDMAGSHGLNGKAVSYEESAGIPLLMVGPGVPKGIRINAPIDSSSFLPTCMGLADIEMPENIKPRCKTDLFENPNSDTHAFSCFKGKGWCMIRKGKHKLTIDVNTNEPLSFYNLKDDPYEVSNLIEAETINIKYSEMLGLLINWKEECEVFKSKIFLT